MNERLETLLDTVRRTAGQLGGTAADAAWGVGKRAEELMSAARLRLRIAALEGREEGCFAEIGEMLYATHTGHPTDSDALLEKLREVDSLRAERARLEHLLDRRREEAVCPVCGAPARKDDVFGRACGKRL